MNNAYCDCAVILPLIYSFCVCITVLLFHDATLILWLDRVLVSWKAIRYTVTTLIMIWSILELIYACWPLLSLPCCSSDYPVFNSALYFRRAQMQELAKVQCSRASQPTFKNFHWELSELKKSVKCISLTVLSEKELEVIFLHIWQ